MDLEGQIQPYCLNLIKKFIFLIFFIFLFYTFYSLYLRDVDIINNKFFEKKIFYYYLILWDYFFDKIDYGEFYFDENISLHEITKIISQPSNVYYKFTVVDGWQEYQLISLLNKKFKKKIKLNYEEILADTYVYNSNDSSDKLINLMKSNKKEFFNYHKDNILLDSYSIKEIMIIAS